MALKVRLQDRARLTKDIDLGLRETIEDAVELHERLADALAADPFNDHFVLTAPALTQLREDDAGFLTWRTTVEARLAGRVFAWVKLDISPRAHELEATEQIALPNSLAFADIASPAIEIVDVQRHAAEKLHAIQRDYGNRDNTRVRDLVDLVILLENELIDPHRLSVAVRTVWLERDQTTPPTALKPLPDSWHDRYEQLATDQDVKTRSYPAALTLVVALWVDLAITEESCP